LKTKAAPPTRKRKPDYSQELVSKVRDIRKADPTYSAKKIRPILLRESAEVPSVATLRRLIRRNNLFFHPDTKLHKKRSQSAKQVHQRLCKPANLYADAPAQIIEFDMKHVYLLGVKQYAFCAIDVFTKDAVVHIA